MTVQAGQRVVGAVETVCPIQRGNYYWATSPDGSHEGRNNRKLLSLLTFRGKTSGFLWGLLIFKMLATSKNILKHQKFFTGQNWPANLTPDFSPVTSIVQWNDTTKIIQLWQLRAGSQIFSPVFSCLLYLHYLSTSGPVKSPPGHISFFPNCS